MPQHPQEQVAASSPHLFSHVSLRKCVCTFAVFTFRIKIGSWWCKEYQVLQWPVYIDRDRTEHDSFIAMVVQLRRSQIIAFWLILMKNSDSQVCIVASATINVGRIEALGAFLAIIRVIHICLWIYLEKFKLLDILLVTRYLFRVIFSFRICRQKNKLFRFFFCMLCYSTQLLSPAENYIVVLLWRFFCTWCNV